MSGLGVEAKLLKNGWKLRGFAYGRYSGGGLVHCCGAGGVGLHSEGDGGGYLNHGLGSRRMLRFCAGSG